MVDVVDIANRSVATGAENKPNSNTSNDISNDNDAIASKPNAHLLLGLDYGVKKMGMALGNSVTETARAFDILAMNNGQPDWDNLLGIIKTWGITQVIIGLPLNMDGSSSMLSKRAHKFARRLAHRLVEQHMPVVVNMCDERLTSVAARDIAWENGWIQHERDPIDDISACLLLSTYFADPSSVISIETIKIE